MGSVVLLLAIVIASMLCVRIGAVALELTGMDKEKARFQALSAFTNTGFTTSEAEGIMHDPTRRRIVTVLIVLGHAGTVSVIATFATSLIQREPLHIAMNLSVTLLALYGIYRLARWRGLTVRMQEYFRRTLTVRYGLSHLTMEEKLNVGEGFGVVRLAIRKGLPLIDHPLAELGLKLQKVQILSITRGDQTITIPGGSDRLLAGDIVVCYGNVQAAAEIFGPSAAG